MPNKIFISITAVLLPLLWAITSSISFAEYSAFSGDIEKYQVGKKVFSDYCSRCHGEKADGRGRTVPMYLSLGAPRPSNFRVKFFSIRPSQYLEKIVRDGGQRHSLSEYMPPFGDELNNQQINDVVYFIQNVSLYSTNQVSKSNSTSNGASEKLANGEK